VENITVHFLHRSSCVLRSSGATLGAHRAHWIGGIATSIVEMSPPAGGALSNTVEVDPSGGKIANGPSA